MSITDELSPEETYRLRRLEFLDELKHELSDWAKRRFWGVVVLAAIVGFFGVGTFIEGAISARVDKAISKVDAVLLEAMKAIVKAEATVEAATNEINQAVKKAAEATGAAINEANRLTSTVADITNEAHSAQRELLTMRAELKARSFKVRDEARESIVALQQQIKNINTVIENLTRNPEQAEFELSRIETEQMQLREITVSKPPEFDEYSQYFVAFAGVGVSAEENPLSSAMADALSERGFVTGMFDESLEEVADIWEIPESKLQDEIIILYFENLKDIALEIQ